MTEIPVVFPCGGDELIGMVHKPEKTGCCNAGVLIAVGGPQYRAGSHRQFVSLARDLAAAGIPAMRFDYRGMGDSTGEPISFEDAAPDIHAAIDAFVIACPEIESVILWGLCDAASACLMYCVTDERVGALVLANPWVRTEAGIAKAHLKHYYTARLFEKAFWLKILAFDVDYKASLFSMARQIRQWLFPKEKTVSFQTKMQNALDAFQGDILFIISGNDLTAAEFKDLSQSSKIWKNKLQGSRVSWKELEEADHTFSTRQWKAIVSGWTIQWIKGL